MSLSTLKESPSENLREMAKEHYTTTFLFVKIFYVNKSRVPRLCPGGGRVPWVVVPINLSSRDPEGFKRPMDNLRV